MDMFFIAALTNGIMLFLTFPISRIDTQFNRLKKQFFERSESNDAFRAGLSSKKTVKHSKSIQVKMIFTIVFISINVVLGLVALGLRDHIKMISHMIIAIVATFVFTNFLLTNRIDETFKKLEYLISEWKKRKSGESLIFDGGLTKEEGR
jgi:hypothetical protein